MSGWHQSCRRKIDRDRAQDYATRARFRQLQELQSVQSKLGLPVERDLHFCRQAYALSPASRRTGCEGEDEMRPAEAAERINGENEGASRRTFQPS